MPAPSSSLSTLRPDLAGSMMEIGEEALLRKFVALRVAPVREVAAASGNFAIIPVEELLKVAATGRAPGSGYSRFGSKFEPATYACEEHGAEEPVDDREAAMYAQYFDAELMAAVRARSVVLRNFEARWAALAHAISGTTAAGTAWSSPSTATPIANVRTAKLAVYAATGLVPNVLVVAWSRYEYLRDCAEIVDRVKYSGQNPNREAITEAAVAQALGVDELIVAGAPYNSAAEGQTATLASVWTESEAYLVCRPNTGDVREPCWGRTFHWGEDGSQIGGLVETYRDETVRSNIVRSRMDVDEKVMYAGAARRITGV